MQKERSQLKAGLFIIISILLIFGVIVAIKGVKVVFTPIDQRKVRFSLTDDVGGLRIGDDVRIGGFKVGVVQDIELAGLEDGQNPGLLITFSIPRKYPLHADAHLAIQTTVTGTSVLNIDDVGTGEQLKDGTELTGHPSALSALFASLGKAAPDVLDIVHDVKTTTLPRVNLAAGKAGDTLTSFHNAADSVSGMLGDSKPDFRSTVANLNSITADMKAKLPGILDHFDTIVTKTTAAVDNARGTLEDIKATVANTRDITNTARSIVDGNRGKFETMIASLKATSDNLKGASAEIRRSPWRLLYHPGPGELDNLELYDAARQFADGAGGVNDAALALRDALNNPNVDKAQVQQLINRLNTTFSNFNEVEDKLWKSVKPE
jgi:phospholipid/cholesterol/gamma-HCH transport system substrate-binding protein